MDINHEIRRLLQQGVADPHAIAEKLEPGVPDDLVSPLIREALAGRARSINSLMRSGHGRKPKTSKRVQNAKRVSDTNWMECLPSGQWKNFHECTAADVYALATAKRRQGEQLQERAERYFELARVMEELDVSKVGEVPEETLSKILLQ